MVCQEKVLKAEAASQSFLKHKVCISIARNKIAPSKITGVRTAMEGALIVL